MAFFFPFIKIFSLSIVSNTKAVTSNGYSSFIFQGRGTLKIIWATCKVQTCKMNYLRCEWQTFQKFASLSFFYCKEREKICL